MTLPDLTASAAFRPWIDPESGITSYLLHDRVAPLQQSFYFTNRSFSEDGAYLWCLLRAILREATLTRAEASASTTYMRSSCGGFQKLSSAMPHRWSAQAESTGVGSTLSTDEDQVQMTRQRLSMPSPRKSTG